MTTGIDAIDAALIERYGDQEPHRFGGSGPAPLAQVAVYRSDDHWHYVGFGLSRLGDEPADAFVPAGYDAPEEGKSGWGFELTFRHVAAGDAPPTWPVGLLMWLAGYVKQTRNVFAPNHTMDLEGSADPETPDAALTAVLLQPDPTLAPLRTDDGDVAFLQVTGITNDELEATRAWSAERFLELLNARRPLGVSDLTRPSILADAETRAAVEAGIERDGSSQAACYVELHWTRTEDCSQARLELTPSGAASVKRQLRGRTRHGRDFFLFAESQGVAFKPGDANGFEEPSPAVLQLTLEPALAAAIEADLAGPRTYTWDGLPGFFLVVLEDEVTPGAAR